MRNQILLLSLILLSVTCYSQSSLTKVSNDVVYTKIINIQENETSKEAKKITTYFIKDNIEKVMTFVFAKDKKEVRYIRRISVAENYYLSAINNFKDGNYELAEIELNKSLDFLVLRNKTNIKKVEQSLQEFARKYTLEEFEESILSYKAECSILLSLGVPQIEKIEKLEYAFDIFEKYHNTILIKKYNTYFSILYLYLYSDYDKAFSVCSDCEKNEIFQTNCSIIADELLQFGVTEYLNDAIAQSVVLYQNLGNKNKLDSVYRSLADHYTCCTQEPMMALTYLNKITDIDESEIDKYTALTNKRLITICNDFDDCIKLCDAYPDLKLAVSEKAISFANKNEQFVIAVKYFPSKRDNIEQKAVKTIESYTDCINTLKYFPSKKGEIEQKMVQISSSIEDCKKAIEYFPTANREIELKLLNLSSSFEELGYVFDNLSDISSKAEEKAKSNVYSYNDKKQFVKYFQKSKYASTYLNEINREDLFKYKLDDALRQIGDVLMRNYGYYKYCSMLRVSGHNFSIEGNRVTIPFRATWSHSYFMYEGKMINFECHFKININLESGHASIGWYDTTINGEPYSGRAKFHKFKSKMEDLAETLVDDIKAFQSK
jgi:hypothetical protein